VPKAAGEGRGWRHRWAPRRRARSPEGERAAVERPRGGALDPELGAPAARWLHAAARPRLPVAPVLPAQRWTAANGCSHQVRTVPLALLSIFYFLLARGLGRVRVLDFFPDPQRIRRVLRFSFGFFGVSHSDPLESVIFLSHFFPKH
jgi:hypothetical protein